MIKNEKRRTAGYRRRFEFKLAIGNYSGSEKVISFRVLVKRAAPYIQGGGDDTQLP